jgi:hypothetical protein
METRGQRKKKLQKALMAKQRRPDMVPLSQVKAADNIDNVGR